MNSSLKVESTKDSNGHEYLKCSLSRELLSSFLLKMKEMLGNRKFNELRKNKILRDGDEFHITLINPLEIQNHFGGAYLNLKKR